MTAKSHSDLVDEDSARNNSGEPKRAWIWMTVLAGAIAVVTAFPPQRRMGIWTNSQNQPVLSWEAYRFDRFEFGYLPSFRWISDVGKKDETEGLSTVTLLETGPYQYRIYQWVIDWQW